MFFGFPGWLVRAVKLLGRYCSSLALFVFWSLAAVVATAEDAALAGAPASTNSLETMVVTAHRVPFSAAEVGSSVSIVDRSFIDNRQSIHGADLLADLPGIAVSRVGGYGAQTQVRVRGSEANHVLVLIDGVKANDPAGSDEFDFGAWTTYDTERVEVVRGPQSALWGSEATAGVVNITTRQASEPLTAAGFVEGGSRDTVHTGFRVGSGGERGGVLVSGSYFDTHGESAALAGIEDDGFENLNVGLKADWRPTDNSRLAFSARHTDSTVEFDGLSFVTGLPEDADLLSENELTLWRGEGGFTVLDDRWDHNLRLTWLDSDRQQFREGDWDSSTSAEKLGVYYQSTLQLEKANQQLIVAVDFEEEKFQQRGLAFFGDPNQDQQRDNVGWVAEYLVSPLAGLNLSGSVRHDDNSDFKDVTTYRLTGAYQIPERETRLRISYGTGQKAPTFIELYGFFPEDFLGNPDLKPEQTRGVDLGVTQSFGGGRWQVDVGYFNEQLSDEIVTTFVPGTFLSTAENLDSRSRREGVELTIDGQVLAGLRFGFNYTFTDSKQPDDTPEVRRPRHMAAANLNYHWWQNRVNVNLNLSYTGSQTDQVFLPPFFVPETVKLADYLLVNLSGRYALSNNVDLTLRVENLLDEDYVNVVGYRSPGRSLLVGVRFGLGR